MSTRVLVTRPENDDGPLTAALRAANLDPVSAPTFTLLETDDTPSASEIVTYPWVAWTSRAAVDACRPRPSGGTLHAAVGGATADALEAYGVHAEIVGNGGGAVLAEALVAAVTPGSRLLYPRSSHADPSFAQRLRSFGIDVQERIAYRVGPGSPEVVRAAMAAHPAAVTFASPSAAAGFVEALGGAKQADAAREGVILVSIGPTTTAALRRHLLDADVEADVPSFPALAAATASALRTASGAEAGVVS